MEDALWSWTDYKSAVTSLAGLDGQTENEKGSLILVTEVINQGQEETHLLKGTQHRGLPFYVYVQ